MTECTHIAIVKKKGGIYKCTNCKAKLTKQEAEAARARNEGRAIQTTVQACSSRKIAYDSEHEARAAIKGAGAGSRPGSHATKPYRCSECKSWHVTSTPKDKVAYRKANRHKREIAQKVARGERIR